MIFIMIFLSDPRVADWMWMQSPLPTISLILVYFAMVIIGPRIMANREPYSLKPILFVFNAFIVILYVWMTKEVRERKRKKERWEEEEEREYGRRREREEGGESEEVRERSERESEGGEREREREKR